MTPRSAIARGAVVALAAACSSEPQLPWPAERLPAVTAPDGEFDPERVELGRLLFHDPVLSSDGKVACVTCHGQIWGLSDGLPVSVGVGGVGPAGTGRTGPNVTTRNSLTLWNVAFADALMWDGRAATLEEQMLLPLASPVELDRQVEDVIADLAAVPEYVERFAAAFDREVAPSAIDVEALQRAIADFERTLVSDDAPYDRYVDGERNAMPEPAIEGMFRFAELGCADCHTPPRFASDRFESIGDGQVSADLGRAEVTGDDADRGRFRVPTLRNIRETSPYLHDGSALTLEDAVRAHHAYVDVDAGDLELLISFLEKGLTDRRRTPDRPLTVPSGLPVPLDGYSVPR